MAWWYTANFDRKRLRRAMNAVSGRRPEFHAAWQKLCRKGGDETDRKAMADMLEEEGYPVEALAFREYTTTIKAVASRMKNRRRKALEDVQRRERIGMSAERRRGD